MPSARAFLTTWLFIVNRISDRIWGVYVMFLQLIHFLTLAIELIELCSVPADVALCTMVTK